MKKHNEQNRCRDEYGYAMYDAENKTPMSDRETPTHPVQIGSRLGKGKVPQLVSMKAYEVYSALYGEQKALITGECRGGFGVNELIGFLYAAAFPRNEWRVRFDEAMEGMEGLS